MNTFILYNWITHEAGGKVISENDFRDVLVCQIIYYYGHARKFHVEGRARVIAE